MDLKIVKNVTMGRDVVIRDFVNLYDCAIGDRTRIGTFVEIQKGVTVGKDCNIQSHSFLCEGVTIEDGCFIGHGVMFSNDRFPKALLENGKRPGDGDWTLEKTVVQKGAAIGNGATILPGVTIGTGALIGAGAVVTSDIPQHAVAIGNPARIIDKPHA